MRLCFEGCFALRFALLGAAWSPPGERMLWACLSLPSAEMPDPWQRGWSRHMCVRVGWVSGSRWASVMAQGEESKALCPFIAPQPWRLFQVLAAKVLLKKFKSIKQPNKTYSPSPLMWDLLSITFLGCCPPLGAAFEVSFSCRAADAPWGAGVTGCRLCLGRRQLRREGVSGTPGRQVARPRCATTEWSSFRSIPERASGTQSSAGHPGGGAAGTFARCLRRLGCGEPSTSPAACQLRGPARSPLRAAGFGTQGATEGARRWVSVAGCLGNGRASGLRLREETVGAGC